jgi:hypothetical protein
MVMKRRTSDNNTQSIQHKAREVTRKSGIPLAEARLVASGKMTLSEVLLHLQLKEKILRLEKDGDLFPNLRGEILAGRYSLEQALMMTRLRKRKQEPDYMFCHFDSFGDEDSRVGIAVVGRRLLWGRVVAHNRFDLTIELASGDSETVVKHDTKFYFAASHKKSVLKKVNWGKDNNAVEAGFLGSMKNRIDIKARRYQEAREADRSIRWVSVEGDGLRGQVTWIGRYEVVVEVAPGVPVIVMRHSSLELEI